MSDWRGRAVRAGKRPFTRSPGSSKEQAPEHKMDPWTDESEEPAAVFVERSLVDAALYRNGHRIKAPTSLAEIYGQLPGEPGTMAWIGLYRPAEAQVLAAAEVFGLHELAVEDAIVAHQRPKLERYGDTLFVVLRAARYIDETEEVDFGEIHLFIGPDFVLTVRHSQAPDLGVVRRRLEEDPRAAGPRPRSGALRGAGRRRRRLRPGHRRAPERHRRDRDRSLQRRPQGLPPHLRALPRSDRLPARRPPPADDHAGPGSRFREVRHRRRTAPLPA